MNTIDVRLQLFKVAIFVNAKVASEIVITYIHHFWIGINCTSKNVKFVFITTIQIFIVVMLSEEN